MRAVLVLLGCVGCDVTLGLRHFEPPVGETPRVTGHLVDHLVTYGTDFMPVLGQRFYPAADVALSVTLEDGATPAVSYDETDGSFTFDRVAAGEPYRLHIEPTDLDTIDYELTTDAPIIGLRSPSRIDREPVTQPTVLHFAFGAPPGFAFIASTGIATSTNPQASGTFDLDWRTVSSQAGSLGLLNASKHDRLYYNQYLNTGAGSASYNAITQTASLPITLTDGVPQTISGMLTPVGPNLCAHLVALRNATLVRWLAGAARTYHGGADWAIFATPSTTFGTIGTVMLVFGNEGDPATDVDVMPMFVNPFPGTQLLASIDAGGTFDIQLGVAMPLLMSDVTQTLVPLDVSDPSCLVNNATPTSEVAIPRQISLDGTRLDHDDQEVSLGTADHVVEWTATTGPVDHATVTVSELTAPANATTLELRFVATTTLGKASLPAALFVGGHTYLIQIENRIGYDVAAGNLDTVHYPTALAKVSSYTFRAM